MFIVALFLAASMWLTLQFGKYVSGNALLMVLVFLLCYVLMHALYVLMYYLLSLPCDRSRPIKRQRYSARLACMSVCSILCSYMGMRTAVRGQKQLPQNRTFVYVSNHRSAIDPILVMDKLRLFNISFIAKPEVLAIPVVGTIIYQAGCLPIDRSNDRSALKTIQIAADYVKNGFCSMGVFPEGTRNTGEELLPFHAGTFKLAQKAKAPLVIACVRGTEEWRRFMFDRRKTAYLDILEVLTPEQVASMSSQELSEYCRLRIQLALYTPVDEDPTGPREGSLGLERDEEDEGDYDDYDELAADEDSAPEAEA